MANLGEERFRWLLKQRGFSYVDESGLESKIEVRGTRPDFYVEPTGCVSFFVEVESLQKGRPAGAIASRGFQILDQEQFLKRIRLPVKHAAKQLRPYRDLGKPMLIVIDNHRLVEVPSDPNTLIQVFGTLEFRFLFDTQRGRAVGPVFAHHGRGQTLSSKQSTYVSAVAWNLPKRVSLYLNDPPEVERQMRLRIVHNPYAEAPLPIDIFADPEDEQFGLLDGRWVNLLSGEPVFG